MRKQAPRAELDAVAAHRAAIAMVPPPSRAGSVVVCKFGGTSVGTPERILQVARRIGALRDTGAGVVAVLSAMGHSTDELFDLAYAVSPSPNPRELDLLVSSGERISCALCAMALIDLGHEAVSLTGSMAGIVTDTAHGDATIVEVRAHRVEAALAAGKIVLVAGFQGVSTASEVTTLGRGGSDTTAVALAAVVGVDTCEIYTDVDGVYTDDPRTSPAARKLDAVSYEQMAAMAAAGAQVLKLRSVEIARDHRVRLHVRSAFEDAEGTWVVAADDPILTENHDT
jgi:aspartate kinase